MKRDKYLHLAREKQTKRTMEHEGNGDAASNWHTWNGPERLTIAAERVGNRKTNQDYLKYSITKIGQNTKSPGDLRRLAVTQAVKDLQQMLI